MQNADVFSGDNDSYNLLLSMLSVGEIISANILKENYVNTMGLKLTAWLRTL